MPKVHPGNVVVVKHKKRFCFFCCASEENEEMNQSGELFKKNPLRIVVASNPLRDTTRLLGYTDHNNRAVTAFMVIQAIKNEDSYSSSILYASVQAEVLLNTDNLVGQSLTDFIDDKRFSATQMISNYFEKYLKADKYASTFLNSELHGLHYFSVRMPHGEKSQLNFKFNYTIGKDPKTKAPIFYMIVHLPTQRELKNAKAYSYAEAEKVGVPDVVLRF